MPSKWVAVIYNLPSSRMSDSYVVLQFAKPFNSLSVGLMVWGRKSSRFTPITQMRRPRHRTGAGGDGKREAPSADQQSHTPTSLLHFWINNTLLSFDISVLAEIFEYIIYYGIWASILVSHRFFLKGFVFSEEVLAHSKIERKIQRVPINPLPPIHSVPTVNIRHRMVQLL